MMEDGKHKKNGRAFRNLKNIEKQKNKGET